ncbi:MAG: hypothetical protein HYS77_03155 [Candidatus Rokubacteria bacterium]|nr:hypothetical protein [Candidatus Rokubacteria bacterium]MBI2014524.1 hypothetical protein [Candidatus Rokubacteria bacterium]MBI2158105.1 hypothetical protein [Candidatus Rokubacteria bacterium]
MRALPAVALLLLLPPWPAAAASFALTPGERTEALRVGARSVTQEAFDREWRVAHASGESVTVVTPFHRLVLAARHAAFKSEKLKPGEPDRLLREQGERLVIWAELRGPREDFARYYTPRILVGDREVEPSFVQNERTAAREEGGRYLARSMYGFPVRDIGGKARVLLVIRDADGRDVNRFTIDLSAMR